MIVKVSDKKVKVMVVKKRDGFYVVDIPGVDKTKLATGQGGGDGGRGGQDQEGTGEVNWLTWSFLF
jgi:hypothetical protein